MDHHSPPPRVAVIDVGSNSVRLTAAELRGPETWEVLHDDRDMTRLATGLAGTGLLQAQAMERTLSAIERFVAAARRTGAQHIEIVATAAVRDAANQQAFLDAVRARVGLEVRIIPADEEGLLTASSVLRRSPNASALPPALAVADLGGGSLEIVLLHRGVVTGNTSLPLGAVRITEAFGLDRLSGPSARHAAREAARAADNALTEAMVGWLPPDNRPTELIGCGGAFLAAAAIRRAAQGLPAVRGSFDPEAVTLTREDLRDAARALLDMPPDARAALPGLPAERADIMPAALIVIHRLAKALSVDTIRASIGGVREGLVLRAVRAVMGQPAGCPTAPVTPEALLERSLGHAPILIAHSRHVARLALDLAAALDLHAASSPPVDGWIVLGPREREVLRAAALLHDVGQLVAYKAHHKASARIIRAARLQGFDPRERDLIAQIARYHRKAPPRERHEPFAALPPHDRTLVRQLAAILRVADGLDRSHAASVAHVQIHTPPPHLPANLPANPPADHWRVVATPTPVPAPVPVPASEELQPDAFASDLAAAARKSTLLARVLGAPVAILPAP